MKKILFKISIIATVLIIVGCRGSQQNKLIGYWEQIPYTEPGEYKTFWQFYAGNALVIYGSDNNVLTDSTGYSYDIDGSVFSIFPLVDSIAYSPAAGDPRGEYWVDELSKENFKITKRKHPDGSTDAVYLRIELVKRN